jgi:hypothetical protein
MPQASAAARLDSKARCASSINKSSRSTGRMDKEK